MPASAALRYAAIIVGTVLWDAGAVLQKESVDRVPGKALGVRSLLSSPRWMAGLAVTAAGWGLYVFGLQVVGVSAARTITGGSYVVLALFSILFLRVRLSLTEWAAVVTVTVGILLLGRTEPTQGDVLPPDAALRILAGIAVIAAVCAALLAFRKGRLALVVFAALSGLLSSVGDVMVKVLTMGPAPAVFAGCAALLIGFYLAGFYTLSLAYKAGTMVAAVVLSDFAARIGALLFGGLALGEPVAGMGTTALVRLGGFLLVLGGSLLLGRFGAGGERPRQENA
jgi:drug/metabolite transporter (DMT)-like permease